MTGMPARIRTRSPGSPRTRLTSTGGASVAPRATAAERNTIHVPSTGLRARPERELVADDLVAGLQRGHIVRSLVMLVEEPCWRFIQSRSSSMDT